MSEHSFGTFVEYLQDQFHTTATVASLVGSLAIGDGIGIQAYFWHHAANLTPRVADPTDVGDPKCVHTRLTTLRIAYLRLPLPPGYDPKFGPMTHAPGGRVCSD